MLNQTNAINTGTWVGNLIGKSTENENIRMLDLKESLPPNISNLNIAVLIKNKSHNSKNNLPLFCFNTIS